MFWSAGCSFLRAEGFSCSLGALHNGLGMSKLQFLTRKYIFLRVQNFFNFRSSKSGSRTGSGSALHKCGPKPWVLPRSILTFLQNSIQYRRHLSKIDRVILWKTFPFFCCRDYFQLGVNLPELYAAWSSLDPIFEKIALDYPGIR